MPSRRLFIWVGGVHVKINTQLVIFITKQIYRNIVKDVEPWSRHHYVVKNKQQLPSMVS